MLNLTAEVHMRLVKTSAGIGVLLTLTASAIPTVVGPHRNDFSGSVSFDVTPNIALFGSVGRTIATAAEHGAGTTVSFGLSLSAGPVVFTK